MFVIPSRLKLFVIPSKARNLLFLRLAAGKPGVRSGLKRRRFSVCMRASFQASWWDEMPENPAPEGRTSLAQRASAGKSGTNNSSPGGTTEFSRTHFSRSPHALDGRALAPERWHSIRNTGKL
jgi:hypothetical protein